MNLIIQNILLGITLAAPIGPASMAIIRNGLKHGFLGGFTTAVGVVLADTTYLLIVYFGLSALMGYSLVKIILWVYGAVVLFYLGYLSIREFFGKIDLKKYKEKKGSNLFFVGYSVNISNPMAVVFWAGIFGSILAASNHSLSKLNGLLYSLTIIIGILMWHTFLSFLSHFGNKFFKEKYFKYISLISGLILIWFGLGFGYKAITFFNK